MQSWQQWQAQAYNARKALSVAMDFKPWTSMEGLVFSNLDPRPRVGELLDLAFMQFVGDSRKAESLAKDPVEARSFCKECFAMFRRTLQGRRIPMLPVSLDA